MSFLHTTLEEYISGLPGLLVDEVESSVDSLCTVNEWAPIEREKISRASIYFYSASFIIILPVTQKMISDDGRLVYRKSRAARERYVKYFNELLVYGFDFSRISSLDKQSTIEKFMDFGAKFWSQVDAGLKSVTKGRDAYLEIAKKTISDGLNLRRSAATDAVISRHIDKSIAIYREGLNAK
jgi:hypothetical protein